MTMSQNPPGPDSVTQRINTLEASVNRNFQQQGAQMADLSKLLAVLVDQSQKQTAILQQQRQESQQNSKQILQAQQDSEKKLTQLFNNPVFRDQVANAQGLQVFLTRSKTPGDALIAQLVSIKPENIQELGASQLALLNEVYQNGLNQSKQSFLWSLIGCGIGLGFFMLAVSLLLFQHSPEVSIISAISGAITELSASTFLLLHRRTSDQLATFRSGLESTQRLLLANSMCENLTGETKQNTRADIIRVIVNNAVQK